MEIIVVETAASKERRALRSVLLLLLPLLLLLLCRVLMQGSLVGVWSWLVHFPGAVLLGYVLYAAVFFLVQGISGQAWIAWLAGVVPMSFDLVSHHKVLINGAPLLLGDLSLARELGEIAGFAVPQIRLSFWVIAAPVLHLLVLVLLIRKRDLFRADCRRRLLWSGAGLLVLLLLFLLPFGRGFYAPMLEAPAEQETMVRFYTSFRADRLSGATDAAALDRVEASLSAAGETGETPSAEGDRPTVIFLMSESFFDLGRLPNVRFGEDPQPHFHALTETCPHGRFYSITYAGGTGYVEMEVLTGLCNAFLREADNLTSLPDAVYPALPCITDVLDAAGYRETFVHSYTDALYNRRWIYPALGFEAAVFQEDFPCDAESKGGYLSDMALSEELIRLYEAREDDAPLMFYAVSMENHQPYTPGRYGEENDIVLESERLSREELESLRTYAFAARDADRALKRLTDYFSGVEEKVMLVFWGDHMPNLTAADGTIYEALGGVSSSDTETWTTGELAEMLTTNYVIWTNYELGASTAEQPESSTMLGLDTLQYLGLPLTDYYRWLEQRIDPFYLLYRSQFFCTRDEEYYNDIPPAYLEPMEEYRAVVRDIIYGEGSVFHHYREAE